MNLYVAVYYTAVWLSGNGAVAIHNLMEDAATFSKYFEPAAEIIGGLVLDTENYEDFLTTPAYKILR